MMALANGTKLGRYEILSPLGAGGMGEVWRARDTRLNREVAIKVLPASLAGEEDRLRRFEQEALATSALNHPNILTVHDFGAYDGSPYIVAELLEGEELRDQLNDGALAVRKAIDYAQQIAAGLAAAHGKGITHRDLKPENLFITTDGRVKILDFGLAKLRPQRIEAVGSGVATQKAITDAGTVMGTVGYMSPEQVRGQEADHRSDIFSFGVILYEMLSGKRTFTGDSAIEVMNSILKEDPAELSETNARINPALEKIVRRCLEKNPERRFHSAHDLGFAIEALSTISGSRIETAGSLPAVIETTGKARYFWDARLAWIVAAVLLVGLLAALPFVIANFRNAPQARAVRSFILPPENSSFKSIGPTAGPVVVSPDGLHLAFVASAPEGKTLLWVRSLDVLAAHALAGTEGAAFPFWSPDSRSLGFFADGKLKKIDAAGGLAFTLCDAPAGYGGAWNRDGVIVFAPYYQSMLYRVSSSGGALTAVTKLDEAGDVWSHRWPYFLPDGQHFLYLSNRLGVSDEAGAIYVASLNSPGSKLLLRANSSVAYAQGYLLFVRQGTLMAQQFDAQRLETAGDAFPIAEQVQYSPFSHGGVFSVSENGVLAYQAGAAEMVSQLTWFDRSGNQTGVLGDLAIHSFPRLSPDGMKAGVDISDPRTGVDIWLYEVARGLRNRFTFDPAEERSTVWSPDGNSIAFASSRKGHFDLYQKAASGTGSEVLLLESNLNKFPLSWSPDGRFILYFAIDPKTRADLWVLPLEGDRKPFSFLQTEFEDTYGQFSPDGRWIAYQSNESGRAEIYVAPFPGPGDKRRVSTSGGSVLRWRGDGKEIFFLAPDRKLMAAEVNGRRATLEVGGVRAMFEPHLAGWVVGYPYDVTADGQRFLMTTAVEQKASPLPITLVQNWTADLKR